MGRPSTTMKTISLGGGVGVANWPGPVAQLASAALARAATRSRRRRGRSLSMVRGAAVDKPDSLCHVAMPIASNACTIARMDKDQDPPAFDPPRLLDGWQPAAAPLRPELDLSGLLTGLQGVASAPREARLDPERVARLKQRGFEMNDIEDIEVPEIRLPVVEDAPPVDAAGLAQALRATVALAQSQSEPPRDSPDLDL